VDGVRISSVVSGHFGEELRHSGVQRNISVFFIHIVHGGSGLVFQNNSVGFNGRSISFINFLNGNDFSSSFF
jgi:hypothetical protein